MYITIKETTDYLSLPEDHVRSLILQKKIRAIFDGEQYLIYKGQFQTYLEQLEKYKKLYDEYMKEPIPEDIDVRDED